MKQKLTMTLHFDYNELMRGLNKDKYLSEEERQVIGKIVESILKQHDSVKKVDWKIEEKRKFETEEYCLNNKMGSSCLSSHIRRDYDYKYPQKAEIKDDVLSKQDTKLGEKE